jgi:NAD(P)-dependent dehydrogenase (short-subunit alcohol dehydrogenase family)
VKDSIFDLSGKVALITGGGSGIGRAYCEGMAEFGADVACAGRTESKLEETVKLISRFGHRALAIKADVSKPDEVHHMVNQTVQTLGSIDIVFANAGIGEGGPARIHERPIEDWDRIMAVNLRSVYLLMREVFPLMIKQKSGNFISTASVGGFWPVTIPLAAGYATAKAGVIMLTKVAARQYAEYGIRVNAICPGWHRTSLITEEQRQRVEPLVLSRVPMKRFGLPEEIKGLAVWLASDASSFVTGHAFIQDGGEIA